MKFADKIRQLRQEQHLTQEQFAIRLNVTRLRSRRQQA